MELSIVFVLSWGLSGVSGVVSWIETIRKELRARGQRVAILLGRPSPDPAEWGDVDAVFRTPAELEAVLSRYAPGVVVLMNKPRHLVFGPVTRRLNRSGRRFHVISVLHSDSFEEYYRHVPDFAPFTHHFIGVSPTVHRRALTQLGPRGAEACSLLPYGVSAAERGPRAYSTAPIRLAYAGRLVQRQKRILDFVPLVERLVARQVDFRLTLIGHGAEESELRRRLAPWWRRGLVRFAGRRRHADVLASWSRCDAFVNLSSYEGTSVAMLEAMAAGCVPVVTAASSGVREVLVDGENGLHVPVGDVDALAARIEELAASRQRLERMGAGAFATVAAAYAISSHADRFLALVERVVRCGWSRASREGWELETWEGELASGA